MAMATRAAAARVLADVLAGKSLNQALPPRLEQVNPRDRGLLRQLCYGSLRLAPRLLAMLDQMLDKPLKAKDRDLQGLLLCGLYQLDATRIPDHAAVDATVAATRDLKKQWARGMTNAILRRYQRQREQLAANLDEAAALSHPRWLYRALQRQWPQAAAAIIHANNSQPPMTLRVNARKVTRQDYLRQLAGQGIEAAAGTLCADAVRLASPCDVADLPGFADGLASVQDEAAQMAATLLDAQPGDRVLDGCAAPGGKTCHLLERQPAVAELVAMDIDEGRLHRLRENLARLGLSARVVAGDGAHPPAALRAGSFDRILVDAPCSATGVIRRHPDVKLLRRATDIPQLAAHQLAILQGLWPLLKPGGVLLYVTCSLLDEENSGVVARFLDAQSTAQSLTPALAWGAATAHGRQLLPQADGPDGLFYALLQKTD